MGDQSQSLPISIVNEFTFPSSVTKIGCPTGCFEDKEDDSDKIYPIQGRLFKSSTYAWLSWGPNLEVIKTSTGLKVASCIFDGGLNANPVITCVAELSPSDGCVAQLAVGIQCEDDAGLVCIYEAISGNPRIIRTIQMPEKVLSICVVSPGITSNNASPLCPLLCSMGGVLAVGLVGAKVILLDLKRTARQYPHEVTHQLVSLSAGDSLAEKQSLAARTGDHLSLLLNSDAFTSNRYSLLSPDGTNIHSMSVHKVCVTALLYVPQIASLVIGFNFGCFQIWNLSSLQLEYTSEFLDDPLPVKSLSFQEPSDDPCNFCYLWSVFGTTKLSFQPPLLAMYSLGFKKKQLIPQYGMLYQDFQSCSLSFEYELQNEEVNSSTRFVSCNMIEKTSFSPSIMYDGDDGDVSLCVFVWATPHHCHLSLFDLNQWYKDQMPSDVTRSKNVNSFWATYSFVEESDRLLDIRMKEETLAPFRAALTHDEYFFPSALSFSSVCLFERKTTLCRHPGVQRSVLRALSDNGSLGVANPTTIYLQCVEVGLRPRFIENVHKMNNVTLEEQRDFLLSLALEHHVERLVLSCATSWADGSQASLGCSLQLWVNWAWQRAYVCKSRVDRLCIPLFNHSGETLDRNSYRELDQCFRQLRLLSELYRDVFNYCLKNPRTQTHKDFQRQMQSLDVVSLYVEVVKWFVDIKLLPEFPEGSEENSEVPRIPYPVTTLSKFYQDRRTGLVEMNDLSSSTRKVAQQGCPEALFIDGLVWHECDGDRLFSVWERDGGSGLYPPPSLQSLLRTYLLDDIPTHVKHCITLYFFLDLSALLEVQDRYHSVFEHFIKFPAAMGVSSSMIKITQAFWLLDHRDFSEAVEMLQDPLVHWKDLKPWQNQLVIKVLVRHGKNKLALDYIRACSLPMTETDDIRLMVTLLLSNGFISQAFTFQRSHRTEENAMELLNHFFADCQKLDQLNQVLSIVMSLEEEEVFRRFLESCQHPMAHDLHVMYYLAQSRIVEAVEANDKFHPVLISGTKRKIAPEHNSGFREDIVRAYAKTIPTATWELARYRPKQQGVISTWKEVNRPVPISLAVSEINKDRARYRSSLIRNTNEMARNTCNAVTVPSPCTPANVETSSQRNRHSRLGSPVQSTPGSSKGAKRERNSAESSLLLHTPHVRRVTQDTITLSHQQISSNHNTPQSILKVGRSLRRSLSRESLPPSVSGTATTPDLEDDYMNVVSLKNSTRLIRFDIPSPDVSVCSSIAEQAQGEADAEDIPTAMEEEEETAQNEDMMERGTQTSLFVPREVTQVKKLKLDTSASSSEPHTGGYYLRSPKRSFVGGSPRKPLKAVSRSLPPKEDSAWLTDKKVQSPSSTSFESSDNQPPSLVENVDPQENEDDNPFCLQIVSVSGGQTEVWEAHDKSSESGEEFVSARSRLSMEKPPSEPPVAVQNIQPRPSYSGYLQTTNVSEKTETTVTRQGSVSKSRKSTRTVVISEDSISASSTRRSQRILYAQDVPEEPEEQLTVEADVERVSEVENLPININTGDLEPDVEMEINVIPPSAVEEVNLPAHDSWDNCKPTEVESTKPAETSIEVVEPDSSDLEIIEDEDEEEEYPSDELADEYDDYEDNYSYVPTGIQRRGILPDNSIYIPSSQVERLEMSCRETDDAGISPDHTGSILSSSQAEEQVADIYSLTGQESEEVDPEELEIEEVCVNDDGEEEEEGDILIGPEDKMCGEGGEEIFDYEYDENEDKEVDEDKEQDEEDKEAEDDGYVASDLQEDTVEVAVATSTDRSDPSEKEVNEMIDISVTSVCTTTSGTTVSRSLSSDESAVLEIGGDETIRDLVGNETLYAIRHGNKSKTRRSETVTEMSKEQQLQGLELKSSFAVPKETCLETGIKMDVHAARIEKNKLSMDTGIIDRKTDLGEEVMEVEELDAVEVVAKIKGSNKLDRSGNSKDSDEEFNSGGEEEMEHDEGIEERTTRKVKATEDTDELSDISEDDDDDGEEEEVDEEEEDVEEEENSDFDEEESLEEEEEEPRIQRQSCSDSDSSSIICLSSSGSENESQPLPTVSKKTKPSVKDPYNIANQARESVAGTQEVAPPKCESTEAAHTLHSEGTCTGIVSSTQDTSNQEVEVDSKADMPLVDDENQVIPNVKTTDAVNQPVENVCETVIQRSTSQATPKLVLQQPEGKQEDSEMVIEPVEEKDTSGSADSVEGMEYVCDPEAVQEKDISGSADSVEELEGGVCEAEPVEEKDISSSVNSVEKVEYDVCEADSVEEKDTPDTVSGDSVKDVREAEPVEEKNISGSVEEMESDVFEIEAVKENSGSADSVEEVEVDVCEVERVEEKDMSSSVDSVEEVEHDVCEAGSVEEKDTPGTGSGDSVEEDVPEVEPVEAKNISGSVEEMERDVFEKEAVKENSGSADSVEEVEGGVCEAEPVEEKEMSSSVDSVEKVEHNVCEADSVEEKDTPGTGSGDSVEDVREAEPVEEKNISGSVEEMESDVFEEEAVKEKDTSGSAVSVQDESSDVSNSPLDAHNRAYVHGLLFSVDSEMHKPEAQEMMLSVADDRKEHQVQVSECDPMSDSGAKHEQLTSKSKEIKDTLVESEIKSGLEFVKQQHQETLFEGTVDSSESKDNEGVLIVKVAERSRTKRTGCIDSLKVEEIKQQLTMQHRNTRSVTSEPPSMHDISESVLSKPHNLRGSRSKSVMGDYGTPNRSLRSMSSTSKSLKSVERLVTVKKSRESCMNTGSLDALKTIESEDNVVTWINTRSRRRQSDLGNIQHFQESLRSPSRNQKAKALETVSTDDESLGNLNSKDEKSNLGDIKHRLGSVEPLSVRERPVSVESEPVGDVGIVNPKGRTRPSLGRFQQLQDTVTDNSFIQEQVILTESDPTNKDITTIKPRGRRAKADLGDRRELQETIEQTKIESLESDPVIELKDKAKPNKSNVRVNRPRSVSIDVDSERIKPERRRAQSLHGDGCPVPTLLLVKIDPLIGLFTKGRHTGKTPAKSQQISSDAAKSDSLPSKLDPIPNASMLEFAASRRLTRHQKAILERSGDSSFRSHGSSSNSEQDVALSDGNKARTSQPVVLPKMDAPSPHSEKVISPTRKSTRTRASSQASEYGSPVSSTVSEVGSGSVYSLRSRHGQSEPPRITPPRRKRKNVLTDKKQDESHADDTSSVASDISVESTSDASDISIARSYDGDLIRKSSRLMRQRELGLEVTTPRKRGRASSESNLDEIEVPKPVPRKSTRAPLKGTLETIREESLQAQTQVNTPVQRKRARKGSQRTPFISPITEEEKKMAESRLREMRPSLTGQATKKSIGFPGRRTFQMPVVKVKNKRH